MQMANPSQTLGYVCRSCRKALITNAARNQRSKDSVRLFSNSRSLAKTLATFTPTSSPEFDALLNSWRKEVFLPSILSPHHQDLVYKESRKEILTTPPGVSVTVQTALSPSAPNASVAEEETIKLKPMNRFDRPNYTESFNQITQYLVGNPDAQAWDNLIPFLEGLRLARIEPYPHFLPRIARKASDREVARWNTILTAATMSKRTGVTLAHRALTQELVFGTFQRAIEDKFSRPEPVKTLQRIVLLLDAPEHCGGKIPEDTKKVRFADMRRDTTVLAVQSAFAAAHALRVSSAKDTDGSVARCIQKLLVLEKANPGSLFASINNAAAENTGSKEAWRQNTYLTHLLPLYTALVLTNKVNMQASLGKEKAVQTHVDVQKFLRDIESRVDAAKDELVEAQKSEGTASNKTRGLLFLENVESALKSL